MNYRIIIPFLLFFQLLTNNLYSQSDKAKLNRGVQLVFTAGLLTNNFKHQAAIDNLDQAKEIFEKIDTWDNYAIACATQGRNYLHLGALEKAEQLILEMEQMYKENRLSRPVLNHIRFLSVI